MMIFLQWALDHPYEAGIKFLAATTAIAAAVHRGIPMVTAFVLWTATKKDDEWLARWVPRINYMFAVADYLKRSLPHVVMGPHPDTQPIATLATLRPGPSMRPLSGLPPAPPPIGSAALESPEPAGHLDMDEWKAAQIAAEARAGLEVDADWPHKMRKIDEPPGGSER
jgi:hypothetical protein